MKLEERGEINNEIIRVVLKRFTKANYRLIQPSWKHMSSESPKQAEYQQINFIIRPELIGDEMELTSIRTNGD